MTAAQARTATRGRRAPEVKPPDPPFTLEGLLTRPVMTETRHAHEIADQYARTIAVTRGCGETSAEEVAIAIVDAVYAGIEGDANESEQLRQNLRAAELEIKQLKAQLAQLAKQPKAAKPNPAEGEQVKSQAMDAPVDFTSMTYTQLQDAARAAGIDPRQKKSELVEQLKGQKGGESQ